ncbi:MAG: energy transducer TonB [Azoarcus sp.]|jgi:protein TonB|nr:energy transducer TonB [Azoarcus sp.]
MRQLSSISSVSTHVNAVLIGMIFSLALAVHFGMPMQPQSNCDGARRPRERPTVETPPEPGQGGNESIDSEKLQAELERKMRQYAEIPRRRFFSTRTWRDDDRFTPYLDNWRLKIERIGTLNYPKAARGKIYGSLVLTVSIRADGSVEKIEIDRGSGHTMLDEAAVRIVRMGEPYAPFPENIRKDTDVIVVTRTLTFTNQNLKNPGLAQKRRLLVTH